MVFLSLDQIQSNGKMSIQLFNSMNSSYGMEIYFFLCKCFLMQPHKQEETMEEKQNLNLNKISKPNKKILFVSNAQKRYACKFLLLIFLKNTNLQTKNYQITRKGCRKLVVMHQRRLQFLYKIKNPKLGKKNLMEIESLGAQLSRGCSALCIYHKNMI